MPLPGGDTSIRKPARIALAYLWYAGLGWNPKLPPVKSLGTEEKAVLRSMLDKNLNTVQTSSTGRLFDAVAALLGIRQVINYEAQAAIELEALADPSEDGYYQCEIIYPDFNSNPSSTPRIINTNEIIRNIHTEILAGCSKGTIAAKFQNTLTKLVLETCQEIREEQGINKVVLSGGVWQNMTLLEKSINSLSEKGFQVYTQTCPT
jgi:hydrogenase maturation protein HypF